MALTLTEANKYTTNSVLKGVIMEIVKDSGVMQKLPFKDVVGNAYQYLRETTLPTVTFLSPNEVIPESTGDVTQFTASITILAGDADVDNFLVRTRSDKTDIKAETIQSKAKAMKHTFLDTFWYGSVAGNAKSFDGVHKIMLDASMAAQNVHQGAGAAGAALSAAKLDEVIDVVRGQKPDCLITTRAVCRRINQYVRNKGSMAIGNRDDYANRITEWNGIPVLFDDFLGDVETIAAGAYTAKTGGATSSLFVLTFGAKQLCGLQNGGMQTIKIGQLESKDSERWRLRWYPGLALFQTISCGILDGIASGSAMVD